MDAEKTSADILDWIVRFSPDALFVVGPDGAIERVNDQAEQLFGFSRQELVGESIELIIPERYRAAHVAHRNAFDLKPKARKMGANLELFGRTRDGTEFPIDISLSPFEIQGQRLVAAAVRDVSIYRQTEKDLRQARDQAERATASKSRFLAAASHDLRQPLQSLGLYLAVLMRQSTDPAFQQTAQKMRQSLDSMGELLNALLDLSKFEGDSISLDIAEFPVAEILQQIETEYATVAKEKSLALSVDDCGSFVRSDRQLLTRIVENFVANAIRYTDTGEIRISCRAKAGDLTIDVIDSGIGIQNDDLDEIFEEYVQLDNPVRDRRKGLGLGLAIARNVARLLEHPLEVSSEYGVGSTFSVSVPLAQRPDSARSDSSSLPYSGPRNACTILLIEDDPEVMDAAALLLTGEGYDVHQAANVDEAMGHVTCGVRPDIVVSDFRLPGVDGIEVIKRIRRHIGADLPAIVITGDTSVKKFEQEELPRCALMYKPVDTEKLIELIEQR